MKSFLYAWCFPLKFSFAATFFPPRLVIFFADVVLEKKAREHLQPEHFASNFSIGQQRRVGFWYSFPDWDFSSSDEDDDKDQVKGWETNGEGVDEGKKLNRTTKSDFI